MRKICEMIVLIRGGGSVGTAIAQRLVHSHFRVCITEIDSPVSIKRGVSLSEAIFENEKTVEDITGEKSSPSLEQIYKLWRQNKIPVVADPEISVRPLLKPDVLINAMMLKRKLDVHMKDAPLVIGIGPGFTAGVDVHLVVESNSGHNLGKVIIEGPSENVEADDDSAPDEKAEMVIRASDNGVFATDKKLGDFISTGEIIGHLNDQPVSAPGTGILCGILRTDTKVLANTRLAAVNPEIKKENCLMINAENRAIAGGVLEAIMLSLNVPEETI